ncbi:MAG: hypothetical protein ACE14P_13105 [Methanotrichaceae archaeon]
MLTDMKLKNLDMALKAISQANICIADPVIAETKNVLLENGYDVAEAYIAKLTGADENTELLRVLAICKKYDLGLETTAQILDNLNIIESGK